MSAPCPICSRINPAEARFCYYDGAAIRGEKRETPSAGSVPFPRPFVYPNGERCATFNELVASCKNQWTVARACLAQGTWAQFLASAGRTDLAQTAQRAAKAPDLDRGLSELLEHIPSDVRPAAKLHVEPVRIELGQLSPGQDVKFELVIRNEGLLLLSGMIIAKCDWLAFGDGVGRAENLFQTAREFRAPVRVVGSKLRAAMRPLEGELVVESNGGTVTIPVRAEVPVRRFPSGVLAGAVLPRDVATLAKANPKQAAPLFAQGAVKAWYDSNGWTYPVEGDAGDGVSAVQQYFEALGLVKPPQLEIDQQTLKFCGKPGEHLTGKVVVRTQQKRPVYALASSNQSWLKVGQPHSHGASATVPFEVVVPPGGAAKLIAELAIRGNGNQRFQVPVSVSVIDAPTPIITDVTVAEVTMADVIATADTTADDVAVPAACLAPAPVIRPIAPPASRPLAPPPGARTAARSSPKGLTLSGLLLRVPRPILFGVCGAIGGLASSVLLGLLIWLLLHPAPQKIEPGTRIAVPASMEIYRGARNRFTVQLARDLWQGPLEVQIDGLPKGVSVSSVTVPEKAHKTELEVLAADDLPLGVHKLKVVALGPAGIGVSPATTAMQLKVIPAPARLAVAASNPVRIHQGGRGRFTVIASRSDFEGEVRIRFKNVPAGVALKGITLAADASEAQVEAVAAADAPVKAQRVTVEAEGVAAGKPITAQTEFLMDVLHPPAAQIDVMFVVDTTDSMDFAIKGITNGITLLADRLERNYSGGRLSGTRIGLVDFRDISEVGNGDRPKAIEFDGETLTRDYKTFQKKVGALRAAGGGLTYDESSLQGLAEAVKQPMRDDATKVIILVTDAGARIHHPSDKFFKIGDEPIDRAPYSVADTIDILHKGKIDQVHIVAARKDYEGVGTYFFGNPQNAYKNFHQRHNPKGFPGEFFDITDVVKNPGLFEQALPKLGQAIAALTTVNDSARAVTNDAPAPPKPGSAAALMPQNVAGLPALLSTETYAEKDRVQLIVAVAVWTAAIAAGISVLILLGQVFYRRKRFVRLGEAAKVLAGGVLAGLIGGGVGQLFGGNHAAWDAVCKIVGWGLLGGLLGAGLALFVPNLRWHRGMAGGLLGGVLGAIAFVAIAAVLTPLTAAALPVSEGVGQYLSEAVGQLAGATILGFCIGMMVALAELLFRRHWIEVAFGKYEVRTFNLGRVPVTIGGDERRAMVYVEGCPPLSLAYRWDGKHIVCKDMATGKMNFVAPGDQRAIGRVTVTVCSNNRARKIGCTLQLSSGKSVQLVEGLPLTAEELEGLRPSASDGVVALVGSHPRDPQRLLLRNRSQGAWTARQADGVDQTVEPGGSVELSVGLQMHFGAVQGTLKHDAS